MEGEQYLISNTQYPTRRCINAQEDNHPFDG